MHVFFFHTCLNRVSENTCKCIDFKTVFARVLHASTKVKISHKNAVFNTFFCAFFFQIYFHKVSQNAWKMYSFQDGFSPCFWRIYQSENCLQKYHFLHVFFFFKFFSTKCFKTHVNCIHFKTVFSHVLHVFTNVRISHKNAVFCTFFFYLSPESVWKRMQNEWISKQFSHVFCTHMPKWKLFTKTKFFVRFFFKFVSTKWLKTHKNVFISQRFLYVFWSHLPMLKLPKNEVFSTFFARFFFFTCLHKVSQNACIIFKTVFPRVLHAFPKEKIAHKNIVFACFF